MCAAALGLAMKTNRSAEDHLCGEASRHTQQTNRICVAMRWLENHKHENSSNDRIETYCKV